MEIEYLLESRPKKHIGGVDISIYSWNFPALEFECKMLVQSYTEKDTKGISFRFDKLFREGLTEGECGFEDLRKCATYGVVRLRR